MHPTKHPAPAPLAQGTRLLGDTPAQGYHQPDTSFGPIGREAGPRGHLGAAAGAFPADGGRLLREGHMHRLGGRGQVDGPQRVAGGSSALTEGELVVRPLVCTAVGEVILVP